MADPDLGLDAARAMDDAPGPQLTEGEPAVTVGPTDEDDTSGPTAGAEEPSLPGSEETEPGHALDGEGA